MDIFPDNPSFTDRHRKRLLPVMANASLVKKWIREKQPSTADLKRAVFVEVKRGDRMRSDVIKSLLVAIQRYERCTLGRKILKERIRFIQNSK